MAANATWAAQAAQKTMRELCGVVISAGKMDKTVKVRVGGLKYNAFVKKDFKDPRSYLVHDPNNSLRLGDVVSIVPGWRTSKSKRHVLDHVIAPAQEPLDERAPILTPEERWADREERRAAKAHYKSVAAAVREAKAQLESSTRALVEGQKRLMIHARNHGVGERHARAYVYEKDWEARMREELAQY